jgi:hypothetical protein
MSVTESYHNMLAHVGKACADYYYRHDAYANNNDHLALTNDLIADYTTRDNLASDAVCAMRTKFAAAVRAILE